MAYLKTGTWNKFAYNRRRKSGNSDFAVSANTAYEGQVVSQYALKDVGGVYEDPNRICRSGCNDRIYMNIPAPRECFKMLQPTS